MKRAKKLVGLLLAIVMVLGMTATATAANITITGGTAGAQYTAYKLFDAVALEDGSGNYNYTMNSKYADVLKAATGKDTADEIIDYIDVIEDDTAEARTFADAVYAAILDAQLTGEKVTSTDVFAGVDSGYYLIAETQKANAQDTYSLVMLNTAGADDIEVNTKEDVPTVDKKVKEVNDSEGEFSWGESADHDLFDVVEYQIVGTVSGKYAEYKSYYYSFNDTMDESLTLDTNSIEVYVGGTVDENGTYNKDGVNVTTQFDKDADEHSFELKANLKELTGVTITADTKIYVVYKAQLNENAVHGVTGNKNEVYLEYENDPYHEGDGDPETPDEPPHPGETPKDINIVFTYKATVDKVDDDGNAVEGAGFTLYKFDAVADDYVEVSDEITGVTTFEFAGLDVGTYKLSETEVPDGYNKANDIIFEVVAEYDTEVDPVELKNLKVLNEDGEDFEEFTVTLESGEMSVDVINIPGVVLPTTGGMGTTIFYIAGAILLIGSAVIMITRKRMGTK